MMNNVCLIGRLCADPELKILENDKKVANITLAVSRSYKNSEGKYDTDFFKCSVWNGIAENVTNYCKKGDVVAVKGNLKTKMIENENGKHQELEIIVDKMTFVTQSKEKENSNEDINV